MNERFTWLASLSPDASAPRYSRSPLAAVSGVPAPAAIRIAHILCDEDLDRAFSLLDEPDAGREPLWIYHPGCAVAMAMRWMKAGAAQVAANETELEELMDVETFHVSSIQPNRACTSPLKGISRAIRAIDGEIALVGNRRCHVLIEGETGTGKEVVARAIHESGNRARAPWVAVNCGAIPESLLEAELFGHVRGAFTGAVQSRAGKFEAANHGTIFLDEIGEMPMSVQARLLRVLQESEVERLGGNERIRLDIRVLAATNADLPAKVRAGLFRQDLFYRLNVFRMTLPSLRERREDVAVLAQHFLEKICSRESMPVKSLDRAAMEKLQTYNWPGNVRELENTLEAAVIRSGSRPQLFPVDLRLTSIPAATDENEDIRPAELPFEGLDYQRALENYEVHLLTQALTRARGNKTAAAELLGLKRTTLAAKLKVLEMRLPRLVA